MDGKKLGIRIKKILYQYWYLGLILIAFFLRLPSLFEPFTYGDEGIYLTLGQAFRKGLVFYRDIHDNKPPLLYLLAAAAGEFSRFRLILFIWSFGTFFMFYKLSLVLFPKNKLFSIISTTLFSFFSSIHSFEGNVANAENFMLLPTIFGFWLILKNSCQKKYWLLAGASFSLATLFKVPAAFDFCAALAFVFLTTKTKKFISQALYLAIGFALPILLTILFFAPQNTLEQYLKAAFFQNLPYLSSWAQSETQVSGLPLALLSRSLFVFLVFLFLFIFRKKFLPQTKLILTWFSFSLFAALLSSRPYPHYLIQVLPSLCLSVGIPFLLAPLILVAIFLLTFNHFNFWHYPDLPYYQNFYQFVFKKKSLENYFDSFGNHSKGLYQIAHFIQTHTSAEEKIFIWGNQPSLYALSHRLPVGRYATSYHIVDFNGYQETINALEKTPPRYIINTGDENRSFPTLESFIKEKYVLIFKINEAEVFQRLPDLF